VKPSPIFLLPGLCLVFVLHSARAETLLEERFEDYASAAQVVEAGEGGWNSEPSDGGCLPPVLRDGDTQFIELSREKTGAARNGFLFKDFPAVSQSKVRLAFRMLHSEGGSGQYVGLFNAGRTAGYAVWWTAGEAPDNGVIKVIRFESSGEIPWSDRGSEIAIIRNAQVPHPAHQSPLATFEFFIDQKTGEFRLSVDGEEKAEGRDGTPLQALSQVVIKGNKGGLFDDIVVSTEN
jgi:hypothetical protein